MIAMTPVVLLIRCSCAIDQSFSSRDRLRRVVPLFLFEPTRCVTQLIGGSERSTVQRRELINKQILRHVFYVLEGCD
jgi:hypothetical protein